MGALMRSNKNANKAQRPSFFFQLPCIIMDHDGNSCDNSGDDIALKAWEFHEHRAYVCV